MFAVCPVNINSVALQVSGKVDRVSDGVLKPIKMRKQTELCLLGYCRSFSVCVSLIVTPCSSGVTTSVETCCFIIPVTSALKMNASTEIGRKGGGECVFVCEGEDGGADSQ